MINKILLLVLLTIPMIGLSQHTFSIVAVDSLSGEIGSAGATCGDSIIWPGTPGAKIISDIIPGVGAIHTQAYYLSSNQTNAHNHMLLGQNPQQIIDWLVQNDVAGNPNIRQYGIVDYNGGHPRSAAFTGINCDDYKNHNLGPNYSIQGNILLGQQILDSMESRFIATQSTLADKLMAALQGAKVVGADTRCTIEGTSSLSAFIRVAKPNDIQDSIYLDINVAGTPNGIEPIDELQAKYNLWKQLVGQQDINNDSNTSTEVFPNPSDGNFTVKFINKIPSEVRILNFLGEPVFILKSIRGKSITIDLTPFPNGLYFLGYTIGERTYVKKISIQK